MESMRATWTDSRLDDFAVNTGRRFDRLEQRMEAEFREVHGEIAETTKAIIALQHTIIRVGAGLFFATLGVVATQL